MLRIARNCLLVFVLLAPAISLADVAQPASLIRIPESVTTVFIAETSTAEFHRFLRSGNGIVHDGSFYMSIGQKRCGQASARAIRRTPLGIYFVTEQLDTSRMHEKYGVTAFVLDYPNVLDKQSGKTGDGIWVHGVDARGGKRPPQDTDGCIALPNEELAAMAALFASNTTPVIVGRELEWVSPDEIAALSQELEAAVAAWASSLERGDIAGAPVTLQRGFSSLDDEQI